jgi:hypothetical protein
VHPAWADLAKAAKVHAVAHVQRRHAGLDFAGSVDRVCVQTGATVDEASTIKHNQLVVSRETRHSSVQELPEIVLVYFRSPRQFLQVFLHNTIQKTPNVMFTDSTCLKPPAFAFINAISDLLLRSLSQVHDL